MNDDDQMEDETPVFNTYTEEEYVQLVDTRRQDNDFVVDDSK